MIRAKILAEAPRLGSMIDATKRSEEVARQLAFVVETTSDVIYIADKNWAIIWANRAFEQYTEYSLAEATGRRPSELGINSAISVDAIDSMRLTLAGGQNVRAELPIRSKSGRVFQFEAVIQPLRDGDGEIYQYIASHRDITQRVAVLARLRESEERYQLAVRGSADGIWDWNIVEQRAFFRRAFASCSAMARKINSSQRWRRLKTRFTPKTGNGPSRRCGRISRSARPTTSNIACGARTALTAGFGRADKRCGTTLAAQYAWPVALATSTI